MVSLSFFRPSFDIVLPTLRFLHRCLCLPFVPASSPSRDGNVAVYVFDRNQPNLPTPFYSILVSTSVFLSRSTVFYSINSPDNSPLSHSVLPVLILPYWSFQLYESLRHPWYNPLWVIGLKAPKRSKYVSAIVVACLATVTFIHTRIFIRHCQSVWQYQADRHQYQASHILFRRVW